MRRPPIAVLGAAVLALAGCTSIVDGAPQVTHSSASAELPIGAPAAFHDCSQLLQLKGIKIASALHGKLSATCALVAVPLDYAEPDGARIEIPLVRIHDSDNPGSTPLLLNPGGPGGSGVQLVLGIVAKIPAEVAEHYDLVGFDPRGVSLSTPTIHCLSDTDEDAYTAASPDVTSKAGFVAAKTLTQQYTSACAAHTKGVQFYNTVNSARDLDVLRRALGRRTTDYLGFSYGTELGSVYAHLYPNRVGAMVLDGAVDPLTSGITQDEGQVAGFERAYGQFAAYCAKTAPCNTLGDPTRAAEAVEDATLADPLPTSTGRRLTANLASTGIQEALYARTDWKKLGTALVHAKQGDGTALLHLADQYNQRTKSGKYTNLQDAYTVISCNDSPPGPSDRTIRSKIRDWSRKYPLFGKSFAAGLFTCQSWQSARSVPPKPTASTPAKVLVLGNVHDPATPYRGSLDLAKTMGNAQVLSWDGEGHTSYLNGSACVNRYVDAYLVSGAMPPVHERCPA